MKAVLIVKQPRKKQRVAIVKNLDLTHELVSTMRVMRPKWKCELIEVVEMPDVGIPEEVWKQALIQPLYEEEEIFRQHLLSMIR